MATVEASELREKAPFLFELAATYNVAKMFSKLQMNSYNQQHDGIAHELRTPNEAINQRNMNIWADMADKICFGRT